MDLLSGGTNLVLAEMICKGSSGCGAIMNGGGVGPPGLGSSCAKMPRNAPTTRSRADNAFISMPSYLAKSQTTKNISKAVSIGAIEKIKIQIASFLKLNVGILTP